MTAWKTHLTLREIEMLKEIALDEHCKSLVDRLDLMIDCLGMCQENEIIVTITRE